MRFKQYTLNESASTDAMLNFIVKNKKYLTSDFRLEEVWIEVAQSKFKDETGFYPMIKYGEFSLNDIGWKFRGMDYNKALADFKNFQKNSAESPKEMKEKTAFKHLLEFASWKAGDKITGISDYNLNSFIWFLRYVIFGKLDKDLRQANDIVDNLRVRDGMMNAVPDAFPFTKIPELKNIQLKRFKNGRLQIKGMSNKDVEEAKRIFQLVSRYK